MIGLRVDDFILSINGTDIRKFSRAKVTNLLKESVVAAKANSKSLVFVVTDSTNYDETVERPANSRKPTVHEPISDNQGGSSNLYDNPSRR